MSPIYWTSACWALLLGACVIVPRLNKAKQLESKLLAADATRARIRVIIAAHAETLARRRIQLLTHDHYGVEVLEGWAKELVYFAHRVVFAKLGAAVQEAEKPAWLAEIIDLAESTAVRRAGATQPVGSASTGFTGTTGPEFEIYCADLIRSLGWNARVTKGSGDQGVDVVADREGMCVVFQCKFYSSPVGNSAVQEIAAGRAFEHAQFGAVLSNQSYTPAAKQLAKATNVQLLNPLQLEKYLNWVTRIATGLRQGAAPQPALQTIN